MNYKSNVAIYLRKSRMDPDDETIEETLSRHRETLLETAAKQNLTITEIYEEVVSGDGLFTRPEMLRLLRDIESGKYTGVLCMAIDRLGRSSQKDGGIILETLKEYDIRIITPQKTYDLNDDIDETSVEMQSFLARQELKSIKRRLTAGLKKSIEDGYHVTEPPYGYRRIYMNKRPTLEIHEEEANTVRMIFDMYVNQGFGSHIISDRLNSMGLKPRKNDHFSRNTIRFILQNPTYTGKIVWNKKHRIKKKTLNDKHKYLINPEEKWITSNGIHPAIISEELFKKAQKIRETRTHPPSFTGTLKNPFAGLVYCKKCGTAITRQNLMKKNSIRLLCPTTGCTRSIQLDIFEEAVHKAMQDILNKYKNLRSATHKPKFNKQDAMSTLIFSAKQIETEIRKLEKQKESLHDLLEQGIYDTDTYLERSKLIAMKLQAAENLLKTTNEKINKVNKLKPLEAAVPVLEKLLYNYEDMTPAEQNELYKKLIIRIDYEHTPEQSRTDFTMNIHWNFEI